MYPSYADLVRLHITPALGHHQLAKLSAQRLQAWRNDKLASGRSAITVLHTYSVLRTALNPAVKWELVPRNVVLLVDPSTLIAADIHPLLPDQANLLIQIAQGHRFDNLLALLVGTGLRLGEAQALRLARRGPGQCQAARAAHAAATEGRAVAARKAQECHRPAPGAIDRPRTSDTEGAAGSAGVRGARGRRPVHGPRFRLRGAVWRPNYRVVRRA
jgi:hypothetical protein